MGVKNQGLSHPIFVLDERVGITCFLWSIVCGLAIVVIIVFFIMFSSFVRIVTAKI